MKSIFILSFVLALVFTQCSTDTTTTEPNGTETDTTTVVTPEVQEGTAGASTDSTATPAVETPAN